MSVLNLVARDQTAIQSLPERLTDETRFDCARSSRLCVGPKSATSCRRASANKGLAAVFDVFAGAPLALVALQ
jgi:hypothetical protein